MDLREGACEDRRESQGKMMPARQMRALMAQHGLQPHGLRLRLAGRSGISTTTAACTADISALNASASQADRHAAAGGVIDKGTKGRWARVVPIIPVIRPLVDRRLTSTSDDPMARLFTGPRGGRVMTAVLRDASHWNEVITALGYGYLVRHGLRHTGLP
jgi:hypothetical protein